jgi:drug/metabolite transporter (DMT)-like permease
LANPPPFQAEDSPAAVAAAARAAAADHANQTARAEHARRAEKTRADNLRGAGWMLLSVIGATAMTILVREVSPELHSRVIAFLRSAIGLLFVVPLFLRPGVAHRLRARRPHLHLARGALLALALNLGFYAIWKLPVATATILFFLAPVFSTLLAPLMVGEAVGPRRRAAVAVGFLGALVVLRPGLEPLALGGLAAIASSLFLAVALLIGKTLSAEDGSDSVFFSSAVTVGVLTLPIALPVWAWPGTLAVWGGLFLLSAASSMRGYADVRSFAVGEASFVGPISYLRLPTIGLAGWWLYGEVLDGPTIAGGLIIAGSTLYIMLRERAARAPTGAGRGGVPGP